MKINVQGLTKNEHRLSGVNRKWHLENKMPGSPTLDERIEWHMAHTKNCTCSPLGGKILEEIKKRKLL